MINLTQFKHEARILGIDDGPFIRGAPFTPIVITVMRISGYIDGFITTEVETDGKDSAGTVKDAIDESRFGEQARAVLSDGACLAGFNVLDIGYLSNELGIPVVTCSDEAPDHASVERALRNNFTDWEERLHLFFGSAKMTLN